MPGTADAMATALEKAGFVALDVHSRPPGHRPIADNRTEEGRAKNRRVEIVKR